jgi:hypothetical protein
MPVPPEGYEAGSRIREGEKRIAPPSKGNGCGSLMRIGCGVASAYGVTRRLRSRTLKAVSRMFNGAVTVRSTTSASDAPATRSMTPPSTSVASEYPMKCRARTARERS